MALCTNRFVISFNVKKERDCSVLALVSGDTYCTSGETGSAREDNVFEEARVCSMY